MIQHCIHCGARFSDFERNTKKQFNLCCMNGNIQLRVTDDYPVALQRLLTEDAHFRENIRTYNAAMSFASLGAKLAPVPGNGPYVFRVQGQVYHRIGAAEVEEGVHPTYCQLYLLDSEAALSRRLEHPSNTGCRADLLNSLDTILREVGNPYIDIFRSMKERIDEEVNRAQNEGRQLRPVTLTLRADPTMDRRRYNTPTANEVAAIFVGEDGDAPRDIHIRVYHRNGGRLQTISIENSNCDPLSYPLLFPRGELGWQPNIPHQIQGTARSKVTMRQYFAYHFMERGHFNPELMAGKLTQQKIVVSWTMVESQRLKYLLSLIHI